MICPFNTLPLHDSLPLLVHAPYYPPSLLPVFHPFFTKPAFPSLPPPFDYLRFSFCSIFSRFLIFFNPWRSLQLLSHPPASFPLQTSRCKYPRRFEPTFNTRCFFGYEVYSSISAWFHVSISAATLFYHGATNSPL